MRVVHLNTHDVEGGAARLALRLAQGQRAHGHEAHLLVGRKSLPGDLSQRFDPCPDETLRPFCEAARLPYFHFQGSHALPGHPAVRAADVVHVHNIHFDYCNPASLSFLSHARPTVWTWHDLYPATGFCLHPGDCAAWADGCASCPRECLNAPWTEGEAWPGDRPGRLGPALALAWKKYVYAHARLTVACPSEWMRRQVARSPVADIPVAVVPNGIDTAVFAPGDRMAARARLGIPGDTLVLGAVAVQGVLDNPLKGGRVLLDVLDRLAEAFPGVLLVNVGSDAPSPHPRLKNIPFVAEPADLARVYAAMDIFVHAARAESFCLVAAEAMACGLPVVAAAVGPLPELVVDGETGFLCPPQDVAALAAACGRLAGESGTRAAMGRAGRERAVARFDCSGTEAGYLRLYEAAIEARRRAGPTVLAFDPATVPALLKTPAFWRAEAARTGRDPGDAPVAADPVARLLEELPPAYRDDLAPLAWKAEKTREVFALRGQGRLADALAVLEALLARWPEDLALWRTKGVTLGLMGQTEAALATLRRCLEGEAPLSDVWLNMADIHFRRHDLPACADALATFEGIDPKLRGFNHRLGLLRLAQGAPRRAIRAFVAELRLHGAPESVEPLRRAWRGRHGREAP
jgi:glycosyltransferase involved in cell wall biosynthesis